MRLHSVFAAALALSLGAASGGAQEIRGTVNDGMIDRPLNGTVLTALSADSTVVATTMTDDAGTFLLPVPAGRELRLRVTHLDYHVLESVPLTLSPTDTLNLEIQLRPDPIPLEGISAVLRRQRSDFGYYLTPDDIAQIDAHTIPTLLARLPFVIPLGSGVAMFDPRREGGVCQPTIHVDGSLVDVPATNVETFLSTSSIRAVEMYRRPNQAPPQYWNPTREECGVMLIWTDYSLGLESPGWPWTPARPDGRT